MIIKKIAFFFLAVSFSFSAKSQTVDEVIQRYITFTGGEQQWKTVHSIRTSGMYNYGGIEFPFKAYSKRPDLYKFVVPFKGKYFAQAFDGKRGWKIDAFKNETKKTYLVGKPALAMANEADVELESPFINYKIKKHEATLEGKDTINGIQCFKVQLIRKNGETETWFFDSVNYALVKKVAVSKNTELENAILDTYYSDYHTVQGINTPFTILSKVNDQTILTITIKKIEINLPMPTSLFRE